MSSDDHGWRKLLDEEMRKREQRFMRKTYLVAALSSIAGVAAAAAILWLVLP